MNSDTADLALECLKQTGAIVKCGQCGNDYIDAYDEGAAHRAYGMAENLRKADERGFRGMTRDEVVAEIKSAIDGTPSTCPSCDRS